MIECDFVKINRKLLRNRLQNLIAANIPRSNLAQIPRGTYYDTYKLAYSDPNTYHNNRFAFPKSQHLRQNQTLYTIYSHILACSKS